MSIFDDPDFDSERFSDAGFEPPAFGTGPAREMPSGGVDIVAVLDSFELIQARDPDRLLFALATAGAQVRAAVQSADRWRPHELAEDLAPRAILVATDASGAAAAGVLAELACDRVPVLDWRRSQLPRWAGPADVLLVAGVDGRHPRLAELLAEGNRRGLRTLAVGPPDSPVAAALGRGTLVPLDSVLHRRAALWTLLVPLLQALDGLGVAMIPTEALLEVADALDAVAEANRPGSDAFTNAAKQLAIELTESDLVIAGAGPFSAVAARWTVASLALFAGVSATALELPDDVATAGALLEFGATVTAGGGDDFFRDRVEEVQRRRRLVVFSDSGSDADRRDVPFGQPAPQEEAADRAAIALARVAAGRGVVVSTLPTEARTPLARFAAATAYGDFTAAYAAVGRGVDPAAVRAGELPH